MFVHRLKLRPPQLLPAWIARPSVERRFGTESSVFSVVAGPGYGKTVVAARLFAGWSGPKAWYSLDAGDADLPVFTAHLSAMITSLDGAPALRADPALLTSSKELGSLFAEALMDAEPHALLVFDDVHVIEGSASLGVLAELVERGTRIGATFLVTGRSMPLALHSLAARSRLFTAGAVDLAFGPAESVDYLRAAAPELRDEAIIERLASRAEGWPAGLALAGSTAALHVESAAGAPVAAHDETTQRLLFEYLAAEVLDHLTERERRFLLETSILEVLERDTCDAIAQSSASSEMLASLARRGLFVQRRSEDAYTVNQLFREFLQHTLEATSSREDIAQLHRRAAAALAARSDDVGALEHLLDGGELDAAAALLEREALTMLAAGLTKRVDGFISRLGRDRIAESPALLTVQGRLYQWKGDADRALATLERATALARARDDRDVLGQAVRAVASVYAARGDFPRLLDFVNDTLSTPGFGDSTRDALAATLGALMIDSGRYDEALEVFGELMPSVVARGDFASQGKLLHNTAVAHVRRGDPYAGLAMYQRALKVKRGVGQRVSAMISLGNMIFVLREVGDLDEAERLVRELLDEAYDVGNATLVSYALENDGALRLRRGDLDGAERAYREAEKASDPGDVLVLPDIWFGLASVALARGHASEADVLCTKGIAVLRTSTRPELLAAWHLLRAECAVAAGEYEHARELALEAIAAAHGGADTLIATVTGLDAAALLVRSLTKLPLAMANEAEREASAAAAHAIGLLHQRNYRFLLRTKARLFTELAPHLRRWDIGRGLLPDAERAAGNGGLRVEMLGGLRVVLAGEPLPAEAWKRRRARDIFAYLVSLRGKPVSRTRLIDLYWPDTDADAAHDNLRVTISAVRKALGDVVKFEANGYRFVPPPDTVVDTELFDEHVDAGRQAVARGATGEARAAFMAAVDLYRGEFLDGLDDGGWQWRDRERLQAAALEALRWLATDREGELSFRRLMLDRLLELAPFEIDAVRLRLEFMLAETRIDDARREYEEWRRRYRASVGSEPPELWEGSARPAQLAGFVHDLSQAAPYTGKQRKSNRIPSPAPAR